MKLFNKDFRASHLISKTDKRKENGIKGKKKRSSCTQQTYLNINDQSVTQGNGDEEEGNRSLVL